MTTRAEFHFSWVYTFSATPRSLRIWAPVPPRETGCDPAIPAQLCWSSGSSFPHRLSDSMQIWLAVHLNRPVKGQRLDNLAFFSVPWRFCNCYGFFLVFEILNFRQINSTQPTFFDWRWIKNNPKRRKTRHVKSNHHSSKACSHK